MHACMQSIHACIKYMHCIYACRAYMHGMRACLHTCVPMPICACTVVYAHTGDMWGAHMCIHSHTSTHQRHVGSKCLEGSHAPCRKREVVREREGDTHRRHVRSKSLEGTHTWPWRHAAHYYGCRPHPRDDLRRCIIHERMHARISAHACKYRHTTTCVR